MLTVRRSHVGAGAESSLYKLQPPAPGRGLETRDSIKPGPGGEQGGLVITWGGGFLYI